MHRALGRALELIRYIDDRLVTLAAAAEED
jgi:hypothetical protein